jgi:kynureninase
MGLATISPRTGAGRGAHVSLVHPEGFAIVQALVARGVVGDFRAPDAMRFGFSPLYVRYVDVWDAMEHLRDILTNKAWDAPEFRRRTTVT